MAHYMIQAAYTAESVASMVKNPQNRTEALRPVVEGLGGKIEEIFMSFGEYDAVAIIQMPDNVSMTAFAMATAAAKGVSTFKTTPLITMEDGVKAMARAGEVKYQPPGS